MLHSSACPEITWEEEELEKVDPGGRKAGASCEVGGIYCSLKPLLSLQGHAAPFTARALGPAAPQRGGEGEERGSSAAGCSEPPCTFFQHLAVNVSAPASCVWSQGLEGKSEWAHVCVSSDPLFIWDSALSCCSAC